ncbi:MAG: hypothetical protein BLM47_12945 [Candidatus Reconcilbacillus cellulovorans]|uniref:Uncharacterized protein n=1 Tax=Candidatus Reconcilbacillus cellulovorans TaxID=1906605 RepID=A0A2A6DXS0_9BACL|nr:MAG: hypothetical protein BLM47_12945 [Candidatus Reconcilbacillus cellulovorans]
MNALLAPYLKTCVEIDISGRKIPLSGMLVDVGSDLLVLFDQRDFFYVPLVHLRAFRRTRDDTGEENRQAVPREHENGLSCRQALTNAIGVFCEIYVTGNQPLYGYVVNVLNDYFVFDSPVHNTVFVAMRHLKYLAVPSAADAYAVSAWRGRKRSAPPPAVNLAKVFDQQIKKCEGQFVVLNLGEQPDKSGYLRKVEYPMLELVGGKGEASLLHAEHVQTIQLP